MNREFVNHKFCSSSPHAASVCPESFGGFVKNIMSGKLFFLFDHDAVPLYCTQVLCTQGCHNILLIGCTVVGSLLIFELVVNYATRGALSGNR